MKKLNIIAAMTMYYLIGIDEEIPFKLTDDFKENFVPKTTGCPVIMGRNTCMTLKRSLKDRTNIVLSKDPDFKREGFYVFNDILDAIKFANQSPGEIIWCLGGAEIYNEFQRIFVINEYHITIVDDGKTLFEISKQDDRIYHFFTPNLMGHKLNSKIEFEKREPKDKDHGNSHNFSVCVFDRNLSVSPNFYN